MLFITLRKPRFPLPPLLFLPGERDALASLHANCDREARGRAKEAFEKGAREAAVAAEAEVRWQFVDQVFGEGMHNFGAR